MAYPVNNVPNTGLVSPLFTGMNMNNMLMPNYMGMPSFNTEFNPSFFNPGFFGFNRYGSNPYASNNFNFMNSLFGGSFNNIFNKFRQMLASLKSSPEGLSTGETGDGGGIPVVATPTVTAGSPSASTSPQYTYNLEPAARMASISGPGVTPTGTPYTGSAAGYARDVLDNAYYYNGMREDDIYTSDTATSLFGLYRNEHWCSMFATDEWVRIAQDHGVEAPFGPGRSRAGVRYVAQYTKPETNLNGESIYQDVRETGRVDISRIKPGDLIVYGTGENGYNHIGIVSSVDEDGNIHTIEGNTTGPGSSGSGDQFKGVVNEHVISPNDPDVVGYVHMNEWAEANLPPAEGDTYIADEGETLPNTDEPLPEEEIPPATVA